MIRIPTNQGASYFKASIPSLAQEATCTRELGWRRPDLLPTVLAVNDRRGWFISGDAGFQIDGNIEGDFVFLSAEQVVADYAELQRDKAADYQLFLQIGLPDRRLSVLPR